MSKNAHREDDAPPKRHNNDESIYGVVPPMWSQAGGGRKDNKDDMELRRCHSRGGRRVHMHKPPMRKPQEKVLTSNNYQSTNDKAEQASLGRHLGLEKNREDSQMDLETVGAEESIHIRGDNMPDLQQIQEEAGDEGA